MPAHLPLAASFQPQYLSPSHISLLRRNSAAIEQAGQLTDEVLALIERQRWFELLTPRACGGLERPLPEVVRIFEEAAFAEGNAGWCINLGAGANMFAGYFEPAVAKALFGNARTCIAGSGATTGTALAVDGGYRINGRWKYASGASHATHFTFNALLHEADTTPIRHADGSAAFRAFIVPAEKVHVRPTWQAMGLKGTASHDFEVNDVFVPTAHSFSLLRPSEFAKGPLYRFPFEAMAVTNMAAMLTGMALHYLQAFAELAQSKTPQGTASTLQHHPVAQQIMQTRQHALGQARAAMLKVLDDCWQRLTLTADATLPQQQSLALQHAARHAAQQALALVDALHPLCGMSAVAPAQPLNKIWRDVHTASQHYLLSPLHGQTRTETTSA